MPDVQLVQYLKRVPLFAKLSDAELAGLAERMRIKAFKRGETLFRKDDPGPGWADTSYRRTGRQSHLPTAFTL